MKLCFSNLTKVYGSKTVLDIEYCEIPSGAITGIIGPNGAGKTTLMNGIAGLGTLDSGEILYELEDGSFSANIPTQLVTMIFQTPYMLHTTVEKNIAYPMKLRKLEQDTINRRVGNLLKEFNLEALAKNKAWRLSGGETQKVALARAIALKPKLLLLDEPTSNIDNIHVATIESALIKERDKNHTTMVFISHNLIQIRRLCDYVIFMDKGQVIEQGTAHQVLHEPQNKRTQDFVAGELLL